ncbi:hypothetical protein MNBD_BACTEROID03-1893 [hydrothermal vent metagenome]|uniref:Uncharacterized protein n=1 Tax=hydrothermal vent metagenome TaxID=652676 RepID=A0A3B0TQC5_9ZZZZ
MIVTRIFVHFEEARYPVCLQRGSSLDNVNQGLTNRTKPFDRVSSYSLPQMDSVLSSSRNLQNVSDNLRSRYVNSTEGFLQELTTQYINLRR